MRPISTRLRASAAALALAVAIPAQADILGPPGASPANLFNVGAWKADVTAAGSGYKVGDTITPSTGLVVNSILGGALSTAKLVVAADKVVSATVAAGGSGGTNGTQIVTGTTGTGTKFQASVTVSGGAIAAVNAITVPGAYLLDPTSLGAEPVTGAGLAGAQLSLTMGVLSLNVQNPGSYAATTVNPLPATQGATSGGGTGATFNLTFAQEAIALPGAQADSQTTLGISSGLLYCIGYKCLNSVASGYQLVGFGWNALANDTTGYFNAAFGINALGGNTTGYSNTAVGVDALRDVATANNTVAIGASALRDWLCTQCVALGAGTLEGNPGGSTSGNNNVAIGFQSMVATAATSANNNIAIGQNTLPNITSGAQNEAIGSFAGQSISTGGGNNIVGNQAGKLITTGSNNAIFGNNVASVTLATGSRNVLIGTANNCDSDAGGSNDQFKLCASSGSTPLLAGSLASGSLSLTVGGTLGIPQATWADNQTCTPGQFSVDANYIYVCTAANTVKRAALSTF